MDFEREKPKCKFSIPDRITVRQQLEYYSLAGGVVGREMLFRYWEGARALITIWDCELIPDKDVSLDDITDPEQTQLVIWAGLQVRTYMNMLDSIPKN